MNKKVLGIVVAVSLIILIVLIVMVSLFLKSPKKEVIKKLDGGDISLTYTDDTNGLSISDLKPISDATGMKLDRADMFFDFSVSTDLMEANTMEYEISVKKDNNYSTVLDDNIRVYLEEQKGANYVNVFGPKTYNELEKKSSLGTKKGYMPVYKVKKTKSDIDNYRLRVWLYDKATVPAGAKQNVTMKVYVNGKAS